MQNIFVPKERIYESKELSLIRMSILSIAIGILTGFSAIVFMYLISVLYNIFFFGKFSFTYRPEIPTPASPLGPLIILVPVLGAFILIWLITTFVKNSKGHGVPYLINRMYHPSGKNDVKSGIIMGFSAAVSIGTGGSTGNESPYIQVASSISEGLSDIFKLSKRQRNILIAAGAAAGLGTCLNAPLAGVVFAIELILVTINITSILPVTIATIVSVYIYRIFFGVTPAFYLSSLSNFRYNLMPFPDLIMFLIFGFLVGVVSVFYIKLNKFIGNIFSLIKSRYLRHMLGMFIVGILLYLMVRNTGYYYIDGLGEYAVLEVLKQYLLNPWFLLLLVLLKILATSLTVGSGSSGGVFTPLIFIGAVFGGFCFNILNQINPDINISSYIFITAGIAGIISSTIGAFITSIVVVFELFGNTHYILPIILVSAIAFATRYIFRTFSIYTMTLKEKGLIVPEGLQAAILPAVNVTEIMDTSFKIININEISEIIIDIKKEDSPDYIIVTDNENSFKGIINNSEISDGNEPKDIIDSNICLFSDRTNITELVSIFRERNLKYALIYSGIKNNDNCDITGIISLKEITELSKKEYFWLN